METMLASLVFGLLAVGIMTAYRYIILEARAGSSQARFLGMARIAQERITRYVENGKAVSLLSSNTITIVLANSKLSSIAYVDLDNNPATVSNNVILYTPDIDTTNGVLTLCSFVRPLDDGSWIFTNLPSSPSAIRVGFHVGDGTNAAEAADTAGTGLGFQGTEVRFSVTSRNLQKWYQQ